MHNLHAIFAKFHGICKQFGKTLVDEKGNQSRREVVPRFSNLEVIALSLPDHWELTVKVISLPNYRSAILIVWKIRLSIQTQPERLKVYFHSTYSGVNPFRNPEA